MSSHNPRLKLSYLYGGEVVYQAGEVLEPRELTDYEFVYIISGNVCYTISDETYRAPPGAIILGRPGSREQYRWDTTQPTRHAYFHFAVEHLPGNWPEPSLWPHIREKPEPVVASLFRHIMRHIYEHSDWPAMPPGERDCLLIETLIDTFIEVHVEDVRNFECDRPEPARRALKWMRQRIDDAPREAFTLMDIATAAGCTPKHLCRVFRTSIGHSPVHTGTLMRLQLAVALLTRSNLSIKEIASRCGFDNPLYFSRCFSRTFGRPPSAIRHDLAQGTPPPADPLPVDITPRIHW